MEIVLFQYISCCSLSYFVIYFNHLFYCFNTSHVVVYQKKTVSDWTPCRCFNTSHVVVYLHQRKLVRDMQRFQYISCCSLSNWDEWKCPDLQKFQYISCCSLSISRMSGIFIIFPFQYISCCSLSEIHKVCS